MGGFSSIPGLQTSLQQQPSAAGAQQQPAQNQQQSPQSQPDPILQNIQDRYQQAATQKWGVKQQLQNFFSGMAHGMLPVTQTPEYEREKALTDLVNYKTMQGNEALRNMQAQQAAMVTHNMMRQPVPSDIAASYGIAPGTQMTPAELVQSMWKHNQEQTTLGAAGIRAEGSMGVALINQGGGLQLPVDKTTAQLVGDSTLEGKTLGMGGWKMINSALTAKGYKIQDMGTDGTGPQQGTWVIDRAGNPINQVTDKSITKARGIGFAQGRAMYTPFETVEPGTNTPTTISNLKAIQSGAPRVPIAQASQLGAKYSQFNDAYGILDNIDKMVGTNPGQVNFQNADVRARVAAGFAAIKDPATNGLAGEVLSNFLARQPIGASLKPEERELVLNMAQGKAAATGLRGILGQAGTNEMQQRLDAGLFPGGQAVGSNEAVKQQTQATRGLLDRFVVGQPQVGLNAPGSSTALKNKKKGGGNQNPQGALTADEARQYLLKAGGDKDKARAAAKADGRTF